MKSKINFSALVLITALFSLPLVVMASWASYPELELQGSTQGYLHAWESEDAPVTNADGELSAMWTGDGIRNIRVTNGSLPIEIKEWYSNVDYLSIGHAIHEGAGHFVENYIRIVDGVALVTANYVQ